jgi:hypothetical protein
MTIQRIIELLEIEHECILRAGHDACDRNCADCDLVQDDGDLHEMYTDVITLLKEQEAREQCLKTKCVICPHCNNCDVDENGLLKEQEAVKPIYSEEKFGDFLPHCPVCKKVLPSVSQYGKSNFCYNCKQEVKWNG